MIMTAGTADVSVAEEARVTAQVLGDRVTTLYDVGVAGLHRVLDRYELFEAGKGLVLGARIGGALPGVVGGMVGQPVIAVPPSRGDRARLCWGFALPAMVKF